MIIIGVIVVFIFFVRPHSPESIAMDIKMDMIKKYLETLEKPEDMDQEKFKKWILKTR
jgi:hypothetical protein